MWHGDRASGGEGMKYWRGDYVVVFPAAAAKLSADGLSQRAMRSRVGCR
jgi:hypothetical protein